MFSFKPARITLKLLLLLIVTAYVVTFVSIDLLRIKHTNASALGLPEPTELLQAAKTYSLPMLTGLQLDPNDPLRIDFIVDTADQGNINSTEADTLVQYFLTALTVPEDKLWVNLSPYESDRILDDELAQTYLGRQLLEQDYLLKQLSAAFTHPDTETGQEYWGSAGTTLMTSADNFNKIWISPNIVELVESENSVFITEASLKVQSEHDYVAQAKVSDIAKGSEVIIPAIHREVNYGRHFAKLRQVYRSVILAKWFKEIFFESFYKHYIDRGLIKGVDNSDASVRQKVYELYCQSFKKGVYDVLRQSDEMSKRRYFSGGCGLAIPKMERKELKHFDIPKLTKNCIGPAGIISSALNSVNEFESISSSSLGTEEKIDRAIDGKRGLVCVDNIDALDFNLAARAKSSGQDYLRVTLRDFVDSVRLMSKTVIRNGWFENQPGPIASIVSDGGMLLIDYSNSDPELIEEFGSLYDSNSFFKDLKASENLVIVGALSPDKLKDVDTTFDSRFKEIVEIENIFFDDPILNITTPPENIDNAGLAIIETYGKPDFRKYMVGMAFSDGEMEFKYGALAKAVEESKDLIVKGDIWNNEEFLDFIRTLLRDRSFSCNGKEILLPDDFKIYREATDYSQAVVNKEIVPVAQNSELESFPINAQTQDSLFTGGAHASDKYDQKKGGLFSQRPGLLRFAENGTKMRFQVTEKLDDWVWHSIMHAKGDISIEVLPGVYIPQVYKSYIDGDIQNQKLETEYTDWEQVKTKQVISLECEDILYAESRLKKEYKDEISFFPITSDTTYSQVFGHMNISPAKFDNDDGWLDFDFIYTQIIDDLIDGKTVVLSGIDSNPELLAALETAVSNSKYLVLNGYHYNINNNAPDSEVAIKGKLILLSKESSRVAQNAQNRARFELDVKDYKEVIKQKYKNRFNEQEFDSLVDLITEVEKTLPAPQKGEYPSEFTSVLSRLLMLYEHGTDMYQAFEDVYVPLYNGNPEVEAYLRTIARRAFVKQEQSPSIDSKKLIDILDNKMESVLDKKGFMWQLAECFNAAALGKILSTNDYMSGIKEYQFNQIISNSLIAHYQKINPEKAELFKIIFGINNLSMDHVIELEQMPVEEESFRAQEDKVMRLLNVFNAVFLKGPPGAGKSFLAEKIGSDLGFKSENIVGPVTVGSDTKQTGSADPLDNGMIGSTKFDKEKGSNEFKSGTIAKWIPQGNLESAKQREPRLLVVDEANLAEPDFWNFLAPFFKKDASERYIWVNGEKRFFNPKDKIIFTGNQETLNDRNYIDLLMENVVSVNFKPHGRNFFKRHLEDHLYDNKKIDRATEIDIKDAMLDLHYVFERMGRDRVYSPRDLQEFAARVNTHDKTELSIEDLVYSAWKLYSPGFDLNQRNALANILYKKWGVQVDKIHDKEILDYIEENKDKFKQNHNVTLVHTAARMGLLVKDFLKMQQIRAKGFSTIQGKRAIIAEGVSGRGKDDNLIAALEAEGYREISIAKAGDDLTKFYHVISATTDTEHMAKIIKDASANGSVVVIRELNRLPAGFAEGLLNAPLCGVGVHPGFAVCVTANPAEFGGRYGFSTAAQNRTIYSREFDYEQDELDKIVSDLSAEISKEDRELLINTHTWIRQNVDRINQKPTTRHIRRVIALFKQNPDLEMSEIIERVYGSKFLNRLVKSKSRDEIEGFEEKSFVDPVRVLELETEYMLPPSDKRVKLSWLVNGVDAGSIDRQTYSLNLDPELPADRFFATIDHEAGHGISRVIPDLTPSRQDDFWRCFMFLEDMRIENRMVKKYPFSRLRINEAEDSFVAAVQMGQLQYFLNYMKQPTHIFLNLLTAHAKGRLTKESIETLAELMDQYFQVPIVKLALKHLDTAREIYSSLPKSKAESDVLLAQYKALKLIRTLEKDYLNIALFDKKEERKKQPDESEQKEKIKNAEQTLSNVDVNLAQAESKIEKTTLDSNKKETVVDLKQAKEKRYSRLIEELELMLEDLSSNRLHVNRLAEIERQLLSTEQIHTLVYLKKEFENDIRAKDLLARVGKKIRFWRTYQYSMTKKDNDSIYSSSLQDLNSERPMLLSGGMGSGSDQGGQFQRYGTNGEQAIGQTSKIHIAGGHAQVDQGVTVRAREDKPIAVTVPVKKRQKRRVIKSSISEISKRQESTLVEAIDEFYKRKMGFNRQHGDGPNFDESMLPDMGNVWYRVAGESSRELKELVIVPGKSMEFNPLLVEALEFLISKGFTFTVYTSEGGYVENIQTVSDINNYFNNSINVENIIKDLKSRKRADDYQAIDLNMLIEKLAPIYTHAAMQNMVNNKDEALGQSEETDSSKDTNRIIDEKEYQGQYVPSDPTDFKKASEDNYKILVNKIVQVSQLNKESVEKYLVNKRSDGYIDLVPQYQVFSLGWLADNDMRSVLPFIRKIDFSGARFDEWDKFPVLVNLEELKVDNSNINTVEKLAKLRALKEFSFHNCANISKEDIEKLNQELKKRTSIDYYSVNTGSRSQIFTDPAFAIINRDYTEMTLFKYQDGKSGVVPNKKDRLNLVATYADKINSFNGDSYATVTDDGYIILNFGENNYEHEWLNEEVLKDIIPYVVGINANSIELDDWRPLAMFTNVEYFSSMHSNIDHVEWMSAIKGLRKIDLRGSNDITDWRSFPAFDNLRELDVSGNMELMELSGQIIAKNPSLKAKSNKDEVNTSDQGSNKIIEDEDYSDLYVPSDEDEFEDKRKKQIEILKEKIVSMNLTASMTGMPIASTSDLSGDAIVAVDSNGFIKLDLTWLNVDSIAWLGGDDMRLVMPFVGTLILDKMQINDWDKFPPLVNLSKLSVDHSNIDNVESLKKLRGLKSFSYLGCDSIYNDAYSLASVLEEKSKISYFAEDGPTKKKIVIAPMQRHANLILTDMTVPSTLPAPDDVPQDVDERMKQVVQRVETLKNYLNVVLDKMGKEREKVITISDDGYIHLALDKLPIDHFAWLGNDELEHVLPFIKSISVNNHKEAVRWDFLRHCKNLESFSAYNSNIGSIFWIKDLKRLRRINLKNCMDVKDWLDFPKIETLEYVLLEGKIGTEGFVDHFLDLYPDFDPDTGAIFSESIQKSENNTKANVNELKTPQDIDPIKHGVPKDGTKRLELANEYVAILRNKIKTLELADGRIFGDVCPESQLESLVSVYQSRDSEGLIKVMLNHTGIKNVSWLADKDMENILPFIRSLSFGSCAAISDWDQLPYLPNVQTMNLSYTNIASLNFINKQISLKELDISGISLGNIPILTSLKRLKHEMGSKELEIELSAKQFRLNPKTKELITYDHEKGSEADSASNTNNELKITKTINDIFSGLNDLEDLSGVVVAIRDLFVEEDDLESFKRAVDIIVSNKSINDNFPTVVEAFKQEFDSLSSTLGYEKTSGTGGIDLANISINRKGKISSTLTKAPFDTNNFKGFKCRVINIAMLETQN